MWPFIGNVIYFLSHYMYFKIGPIIISHYVSALQNGHANLDEVNPDDIEDARGDTASLNHIGSFQTNNGMTFVRIIDGVQHGKCGSTNLWNMKTEKLR